MNLFIGQEKKNIDVRAVSDLLKALTLPEDGKGIAIAVNDAIVSRSQWHTYQLHEADRIEIVRAVQGG
jgi:sulfur carrier protein